MRAEATAPGAAGGRAPRSARWDITRLAPPSPLSGSNGVAFGPDGRLHVAQYVAGRISALDLAAGEVEVVVGGDDPVQSPDDLAFGADGSMVTETGTGRVVTIDDTDTVAVLAERLDAPVGVAVDDRGRCYVSDERGGTVSRLDEGGPVPVVEGLDTPQGVAVVDGDLLVVETGRRRLLAVDLRTGERRVEAEDLAVGPPPDATGPRPDLLVHGLPGVPVPFADVAAGPDGSLYIAANGEGSVLHLRRRTASPATSDTAAPTGERQTP